MRILYVTSADFDTPIAPTVRARGLARALARRGCEVTVVGTNGDPHAESGEPYRYLRVPYPHLRYVGQMTYQLALIAQLAAAGSSDVLLVRETPYSWQPYFQDRAVFLEVNGLAMEEAERSDLSAWRRGIAWNLYRWGYRQARAIFALTPRIAEHLVQRMGARAEDVVVVRNAVEIDRLYPVDRAEARRALGLADGRWVFYVGSYHPQHGLPYLADAAARVGRDVRFLMAGAGDEEFRALVRARGVESKFHFLGRVGDDTLRTAIGASDFCLNPASPERRALTDATFPQKLLEYLACGRAALSVGDSPLMRDVLDGAGRMIPPEPELGPALARALSEMTTLPLDEMGAVGAKRVREQYGYDRVVDLYLEEFRRRG